MKNAEDCKNIEEIRDCIDTIDKGIVASLALRSTYVKCAAKYKTTMPEIRADERVRSMMTTRRMWAEEAGIDPGFIQYVFETVVRFFIAGESSEWLKKRTETGGVSITEASVDDAKTILSLQKRAYVQEVELNDGNYDIPPMRQTLQDMNEDFSECIVLKALMGTSIVGSVRARQIGTTCHIGRLLVEPIYQKQGIGKRLLRAIEMRFPGADGYELFTGVKSMRNREFYKNAGYVEVEEFDAPDGTKLVRLRKVMT